MATLGKTGEAASFACNRVLPAQKHRKETARCEWRSQEGRPVMGFYVLVFFLLLQDWIVFNILA